MLAMAQIESGAKLFGMLNLPHELIHKILSFLTYEEVSSSRRICKLLNTLASGHLNQGFVQADRLHTRIQREVKAKLPRRESERRNHTLARHVDILSAVETRLSLLSMTYSKYIDLGLCCFIPGKVLDEVYRVLRSVHLDPNPPRAHELLQELRDISSMAMEHFDEKIAPRLKSNLPAQFTSSDLRQIMFSTRCFGPSDGDSSTNSLPIGSALMTSTNLTLSAGRLVSSVINRKCRQLRTEMRRLLAQQTARNNELSRRIVEQDHVIADLNRRVVEYDQRFDEIAAEITRVRTASSVQVKQTSTKRCKKIANVAVVAVSCHSSHQSGKRPIVGESNTNEKAPKRVKKIAETQPSERCLRSNTSINSR